MRKSSKYILLFLFTIFGFQQIEAQYMPKNLPKYDQKQWHFGFTLGVNTMNFNMSPVDHLQYDSTIITIQPTLSQGFNIGIVANKRLAQFLDVRFVPTLSFGQRNIKYLLQTSLLEEKMYVKSVESTFLDFPFTLKYKSKRFDDKLNNMRAYVLGGARYSLDLASQKNKKGISDEIVIKLNPHDVMLTAGVGFDFYLPYFKLGVELQMAYGLINVLNSEKTIYTTNVDRLSSKMSWLTLTFE